MSWQQAHGGNGPPDQPPPWGQSPPGGWQPPPPVPGPAPGVEFAGFGARFVAYVIDAVIVSTIIVVCFLVLGVGVGVGLGPSLCSGGSGGVGPGSFMSVAFVGMIFFLLVVLLLLAYYPWFWSHGGQTLDMLAMGIRVLRDQDGGPVSGGQAILRLIGYWISGAVFYIGFIWVFIDSRRRGWHDLIAGTVVITSR